MHQVECGLDNQPAVAHVLEDCVHLLQRHLHLTRSGLCHLPELMAAAQQGQPRRAVRSTRALAPAVDTVAPRLDRGLGFDPRHGQPGVELVDQGTDNSARQYGCIAFGVVSAAAARLTACQPVAVPRVTSSMTWQQ